MKQISAVFLMLLVGLLSGATIGIAADETLPLSPEEDLLALINQARQNPLEMAESLGMDPEQILEDFPEYEEMLVEGLSPLAPNELLAETAFEHTEDMFEQGFYSSITPDGVAYSERVLESGYPAAMCGESLGMILFANFINPEDAARLIFQYMFQDELDPTRTEKRNILDPCLKEAGISIQSGTLVLGRARWNIYLATCDFGATISCLEEQFLDLINQARQNPLEMAESLGMDKKQILLDYAPWHDVLINGLPPLSFNTTLASAARGHATDMLDNDYYASESLDGRTYEDRIQEAGYDGQEVGESTGFWRLCSCDPPEATDELFGYMFKAELSGDCNPTQWNILSSDFTEVGIGIVTGESSELGGLCGDNIELLVADFGEIQEVSANP